MKEYQRPIAEMLEAKADVVASSAEGGICEEVNPDIAAAGIPAGLSIEETRARWFAYAAANGIIDPTFSVVPRLDGEPPICSGSFVQVQE